MAQEKIRMPTSEGGLVRYFDEEYKPKYIMKPEVVVGICIAIIILGVILSVFGSSWFGL